MPPGERNVEPQKKRSNKVRRKNQKSKPKPRTTDNKDPESSINNTRNGTQCDFNKLTPANLSSLRWDNAVTDATLEDDRIEQYKELRRQRYCEAREQAIQTLVEKMKKTPVKISEK
ncbi:unnamed protein product [Rotaria magnacalcarata]|uniref:Uncharacterized protein n=1 Tax=Rotaria magnacalcarata TaxID=392030 RepID=A0A816TPH0_9BILA|nr:unnamed protein product [Rotaria magnacalcarata]CAF1244920.1 unnamed protein product [Rotaria magnacalcarata]CAF1963148.1 unnamed protein product [Rotaria magnacalcarata]CAF2099232.1 unnamed protein product [Rotaria magnacalcarata]CAF2153375.1 unnamed protein product [Rotaria magnacalcarata]